MAKGVDPNKLYDKQEENDFPSNDQGMFKQISFFPLNLLNISITLLYLGIWLAAQVLKEIEATSCVAAFHLSFRFCYSITIL